MRRRDGAPKAQDSEEPWPEEGAGDDVSTYEDGEVLELQVHDSECDNNVGPRYKAIACTSSTAHQNISIALTSSRSFSRLMLTPTSRTKSLSDPLEVRRPLRSQGFGARTRPSRALRGLARSERSCGLRFSVARKYDNRGKRTTVSDWGRMLSAYGCSQRGVSPPVWFCK